MDGSDAYSVGATAGQYKRGGKVKKNKNRWIQGAREEMERKGTVGKFGRATASKIARGKAKGGKEAKRAQFAENMKRIASKRKNKSRPSGR